MQYDQKVTQVILLFARELDLGENSMLYIVGSKSFGFWHLVALKNECGFVESWPLCVFGKVVDLWLFPPRVS